MKMIKYPLFAVSIFANLTMTAFAADRAELESFFNTNIDPELTLCSVCHIPNGLADVESGNGFLLYPDQSHYDSFYNAWVTLGEGVANNRLLTTNSDPALNHTGLQNWPTTSSIYTDVTILLTCWDQPEECLLDPNPNNDYDNDGLTNDEEAIYGTDPNNPDTDNDGRTDYEEIMIDGTDPLEPNNTTDSADLAVYMTGNNGKNNSGVISYSITVENDGPDSANTLEIIHQLPTQVSLSTVSPSSIAYTSEGNEITFYLSSLAAGNSQTLNITVNTAADNKTKMDFTASVSSATEDTYTANNSSAARFGGSIGWLAIVFLGLLFTLRTFKNQLTPAFSRIHTS